MYERTFGTVQLHRRLTKIPDTATGCRGFSFLIIHESGFAQVMTYRLVLKRRKRALSLFIVKFVQPFL